MNQVDEPVTWWIALLDAAEFLMESAHPLDPGAMQRVSRAIDLLLAHEHTLDNHQRLLARGLLWQRDRGDLPPPAQRASWSRCRCRYCIFVTRRGGAVLPLAVPSVPVVAPVPVVYEPLTQGDLFSC